MLTRDISGSVHVQGQPVVVASLILDADTGLIRSTAMAATGPQARAQAFREAVSRPVGPLPAGPPARLLCGPGELAAVTRELAALPGAPAAASETFSLEAEDLFDSLMGGLAGRRQPDVPPVPEDWAQLISAGHEYRAAEPWLLRGDDEPLDLFVRLSGKSARFVAVVLGQERIQRGLVLYPGADLPDSVRRPHPEEVKVPPGTLMYYLDPPQENPPEFAAKAVRYGWPPDDLELTPAWVAGGPDGGPADLEQTDVRRLVIALMAVLIHDEELSEHDVTSGEIILPDESAGTFRISETA